MSHDDPDWEPGNQAGRTVRAEGAGHPGAPELEDLDMEDPGHTVWIRGRVTKDQDGPWRRGNSGRLIKRVYSSI